MFYIKYLAMLKVHMHAGEIRKLLYGCVYLRKIIHSLKLVDYILVHTHKPYNNLHIDSIHVSNIAKLTVFRWIYMHEIWN